jgi:peptide deformylase
VPAAAWQTVPTVADDHEHGHDHDHDHDHEHDHDHDHEHDHGELDEETIAKLRERERENLRLYTLSQIRQYPDVALRMKAKEVTEYDGYLTKLAERMMHVMEDAQGVGLAATQLGILQRMFVFESEDLGPQAVVNPRIVDPSSETESDEEGCLSLEGVRVPVERAVRVTLEGFDPEGREVRFELEGLPARAVQHETDHLDGVLIIDRTDDESRKEAMAILRPQTVVR